MSIRTPLLESCSALKEGCQTCPPALASGLNINTIIPFPSELKALDSELEHSCEGRRCLCVKVTMEGLDRLVTS